MAHSCPECYQTCYCGGDIDDIIFEDTDEELLCGHCDDVPFFDDYSEDAADAY